MNSEINQMITNLLPLARQAGEAIMEVYRQGIEANEKSDGSFVTQADLRAEGIILQGLRDLAADIPVISEENADSHRLEPPVRFFLVDPLDGTAEFVKADGKGAFTVNIALVDQGGPVAGIIYAPALDELYWGIVGQGAFFNDQPIASRQPQPDALVALASRSHRDEQTNDWIADNPITDTVSIGSSLKFCLIARGEADIYPRFGPTMEWDTAAGHAILCAAGGRVEHPDGSDFTYGKPGYRNGPFIAKGFL
ncbi:MAG: 3'(2'),5'-bisphosphate nucleotidase CysQ [Rhizobiaceae bacterium]